MPTTKAEWLEWCKEMEFDRILGDCAIQFSGLALIFASPLPYLVYSPVPDELGGWIALTGWLTILVGTLVRIERSEG